MAKFYPAYSISFCASERRERRESSGFLVCNSLVGPGVNKKGRKSRTFFLGCRLLRSESRRRESQPSALARRRRRRSSDSVNMATNKMRRTRNQPTVDGVLLASCLVVLVSQPSRLSYVVNKNWCWQTRREVRSRAALDSVGPLPPCPRDEQQFYFVFGFFFLFSSRKDSLRSYHTGMLGGDLLDGCVGFVLSLHYMPILRRSLAQIQFLELTLNNMKHWEGNSGIFFPFFLLVSSPSICALFRQRPQSRSVV